MAGTSPASPSIGDGEGQVSTFYFPSNEGQPVLSGGLIAAAFRDAPEVWAVMQYLGSPEYVDARQPAQTEMSGGGNSGFLSANLNADPAVFNEVEQGFIEILQTGSPVGFDGSDNMPAEVQQGVLGRGDVVDQRRHRRPSGRRRLRGVLAVASRRFRDSDGTNAAPVTSGWPAPQRELGTVRPGKGVAHDDGRA